MAEPAQPEPGAAMSPTGIKQEHEIAGLEGLDFTLPAEFASKRPLGDDGDGGQTASKRLKAENNIPDNDLEDGLALLVQNALSGVGDLVGDFNGTGDGADVMDADPSSLLDDSAPSLTFYSEPLKYVRGVQIHALANLALTLLYSLVQHQPVDDLIKVLRDTESEHGRTFRRLKQSLEGTWGIFTDAQIISADDLQIQGESRTLLDLANLAMLSSWLVEGSSDSYTKADSNFLPIFNSSISDLPPGAPDLYLAIKTQKTIEALIVKSPEKETGGLIAECMTSGLEGKVRSQHEDQELTAADQAFLTVVRARQDELQAETKDAIDQAALKKKFPADEVLRCIAAYVKTRLAAVSDIGQKYGVPIELVSDTVEPLSFADGADGTEMDLDDLSSFFERTASGLVQDALAGLGDGDGVPTINIDGPDNEGTNGTNGTEKPAGKIDLMTDYKELEALVAESTSNYVKTTLNGLSPVPYQPTVPTSTTESMAAQLPYLSHLQQHQAQHPYYTYTQPMPEQPTQQPASGENLPPNQTFPSAILYDKARQAALSKSSTHTRREGLHSTRRPWTQEEEKALMAGLDMVKGPHWSQILTLFGQNGTISDILKDRTQVQLKDKARNLKLFFLKTNSEMPYYLQAVTGELKTRAPTQAARKEAEERARLNSEEDQAKLQGIMALAGGLQHLSQNRSSSGTPGPGSSVVTPAQAASAAQAAQGRPGAAAANIPRTLATTMAQNRPGMQTTTQQTLQSMGQAPPRPQTQLPPHVPRPQPQQQGQQQQPQQQAGQQQQAQARPQSQPGQQQAQPQMHQQHQQHQRPRPQQQPAPHAIPPSSIPPRSASHTPTTVQSPHNHSVPTSQPHTPVTHTPQPAQASPVAPPPAETPKEAPKPPESITPEEAQEAENAAEAALLEGLQAAVAEALS